MSRNASAPSIVAASRRWPTTRKVLMGLALLACFGLSYALAAEQSEESPVSYLLAGRKAPIEDVQWELVRAWDFADPDVLSTCEVIAGEWEVRHGALWAIEGEGNRSILLASASGTSLRIEFEATNFALEDGTVGDITLLLNARADLSATNNGYALTTGSYFNTCTTFYRQGRKLARAEHASIVPGEPNKVVVELHGGHIRYSMNGRVLLEAWEDNPLELDPDLGVGLRTWATRMRIDDVRLYRPAQQ